MINDIDNFIKTNSKKPDYTCTQYANNPYICAVTPESQVVVPQGDIKMPTTIEQLPEIQTIIQPPKPLQNVNYNQITPYINSNSPVFQPVITTKSGHAIAIAPPQSSKPVTYEQSQVVYEGPVYEINPQITPIEQPDSEIVKQMRKYYSDKAKRNEVLRRALRNSIGYEEEDSFFKKVMKNFGLAIGLILLYKFRTKIPIIKRFFK